MKVRTARGMTGHWEGRLGGTRGWKGLDARRAEYENSISHYIIVVTLWTCIYPSMRTGGGAALDPG